MQHLLTGSGFLDVQADIRPAVVYGSNIGNIQASSGAAAANGNGPDFGIQQPTVGLNLGNCHEVNTQAFAQANGPVFAQPVQANSPVTAQDSDPKISIENPTNIIN